MLLHLPLNCVDKNIMDEIDQVLLNDKDDFFSFIAAVMLMISSVDIANNYNIQGCIQRGEGLILGFSPEQNFSNP